MSLRRDNRVAAMQFLFQWSINRTDDLPGALYLFFKEMEQPRDYYAFAEELIHGTIENIGEVDTVIRKYLRNWDFERIAKIDLAILRLAIYEMLKRRDIPPIVSINEAIDLSKEYSIPDAKRFINGILDQFKLTLDRPLRTAAQ
ncbi:MAG: transcription antitermination factor NusB [Oceanipulchritudo sp.]